MKNFVVGAVVVGVFTFSVASVHAALSLSLSDGNPLHEQVLTDSGSPDRIVDIDGMIGNWSISQLVGLAWTDNGSFPSLDLSYGVTASAGNSSVLTITLTETGKRLPGSSIDQMILALGGVANSSAVTQNGFVNGVVVGSQSSSESIIHSYQGDKILTFSSLAGDEFSISEQLIFTGTGHNGGDAALDFGVVPEPGTALAGVFAGTCGLGLIVQSVFKARKG